MELVLFIGIQATGKSTYYKQNFADTHIRLNMDMLKTRHRELILFEACLNAKQPVVIDNTNPARGDRLRYIEAAEAHRFSVKGLYFASSIDEALARNKMRAERQVVPEVGIKDTRNCLELPTYDEGFNSLQYVCLERDGRYSVQEWGRDI